MTAHDAVRIDAPAKLTTELRITGVRDDGYHLIDAEMVTLDLADTLWITPAEQTHITIDGPFSAGLSTRDDNLVARALALVNRTAQVHIRKAIPHGGGLGGGSADAAAILRWAGLADPATAVRIGADVGFCVVGGRARVRGIGEIIDPLPPQNSIVTLVVPPLQVSTPAVYRRWDDMGGPNGDNGNDLEPAAIAEVPALAHWRERIGNACGQQPILAGSGATWFVHGTHDDALADLIDEGAHIRVAHTT